MTHKKLTDRAVREQIRDAAKKLYNQIPGVTGVRPRDILDYLYPEYKSTKTHPDPPIDYINISDVLVHARYRVIRKHRGATRGASWYVNAEDAKKMIPEIDLDPKLAERKQHNQQVSQIRQQILATAEKLLNTHPEGIRTIDVVEAMYGYSRKHTNNPNESRSKQVSRVLRSNGWISVQPVRSARAIFSKPAAEPESISESAGTSET